MADNITLDETPLKRMISGIRPGLYEFRHQLAHGGTMFGKPMSEMGRQDLLFVIGTIQDSKEKEIANINKRLALARTLRGGQ